ncbi:tetratricopeptide repeat protein 31 isoform X2 [Lissotriton helveticus]
MEGAGDARSPYVPPGQFAVWRREDPPDRAAPHNMMDIVKQMIMNDPERFQQLSQGNSPGLAEIMTKLDHGQRYPYYEADDDDDDDDDEYLDISDEFDDEDDSHDFSTNTYCGLQRAFLSSQTHPKPASSNPFLNFTMPLQHKVTPEEAERIARELVDEEERMKNKAEKKKLKKQRQKDRKRQQKLEEELKNKKKEIKSVKGNEPEKGSGDFSAIKELEIEKKKQGVSISSEKGPPPDAQHKSLSKNSSIASVTPQLESTCSEETEESEQEEDFDQDELEAELDMDSSFVNQVWRKVESKPKLEKREKNIKKERPISEKSPGKLPVKSKDEKTAAPTVEGINPMQQCIQFADLGNKMASGGHFAAAVVYFTEAIKLNPRDYRLFGNRSYCWERMGRFNEALGDAEVSIGLYPQFLKGYFRKGKSLMGMQNYTNAILAFKHILQEDSTHTDAAVELKNCERLIQMARVNSGNKFKMPDLVPQDFRLPSSVEQKEYAKMEMALGGLSLNGSRSSSLGRDGAVFITTSSQKPMVLAAAQNPLKNTEPARAAPQSKTAFTPSQLYPIWVGNVTPRITGEIILSHFQRFGAIHSVRILYDRTCAFVNFPSKEAAEAAFSALQGAEVEGTKLVLQLRHPDHATPTVAATSGRPNEYVKLPSEMECHFWRNTGCTNGENCHFRHVPQNRGVDAK